MCLRYPTNTAAKKAARGRTAKKGAATQKAIKNGSKIRKKK